MRSHAPICPQNGASQVRCFKLKISTGPFHWTRRRAGPYSAQGQEDFRRTSMKKMTLVAALGLLATQAAAQDKLKVGILTTLSGPPAALGVQQRNGFQLALKTLGGKLGGRDVELLVQDDELKPDIAVVKAKAFVERDKVDFVVGPIFSNILI